MGSSLIPRYTKLTPLHFLLIKNSKIRSLWNAGISLIQEPLGMKTMKFNKLLVMVDWPLLQENLRCSQLVLLLKILMIFMKAKCIGSTSLRSLSESLTVTEERMKTRNQTTFLEYPCLQTMTQSISKVNLLVTIYTFYPFIDNMFQHKYLIYNRECTLLTYAVQTKIKIDDQTSFKDIKICI